MATGNDPDFSAFDPIDPAAPNAAGPDFSFPGGDAFGDPAGMTPDDGALAGGAVAGAAVAGGGAAAGDPGFVAADQADTGAPAIVKQKGKKDPTPQPKPPKAPANVYLFMLVLSLVFLTVGSVLLVTELKRYNFERVPPTPLR
ncbi:MAG: hypothetical protein ACKO38_10950 [Planctomycetota bacterium]